MRRTSQWIGLVATVIVIGVLTWPTKADAGLTVRSTAMEQTTESGATPLVIVTDERQGRLVFLIENVEVRSEGHPEATMGIEVQWGGGAGMIVREGLGIRLNSEGRLDGSLTLRTPRDVLVRIETNGKAEIAALELRTPTLVKEVVVQW